METRVLLHLLENCLRSWIENILVVVGLFLLTELKNPFSVVMWMNVLKKLAKTLRENSKLWRVKLSSFYGLRSIQFAAYRAWKHVKEIDIDSLKFCGLWQYRMNEENEICLYSYGNPLIEMLQKKRVKNGTKRMEVFCALIISPFQTTLFLKPASACIVSTRQKIHNTIELMNRLLYELFLIQTFIYSSL